MIHSYKKQLVKKMWGRILCLAWLKYAVAPLQKLYQKTKDCWKLAWNFSQKIDPKIVLKILCVKNCRLKSLLLAAQRLKYDHMKIVLFLNVL